MFRGSAPALFLCFILAGGIAAYGQTISPKAAEIKAKVERIDSPNKITVIRNDGTKIYGTVRTINWDTFSIDLSNPDVQRNFRYEDVQDVLKGNGRTGFFDRNVKNKQNLIVGAAMVGGLILLILAR